MISTILQQPLYKRKILPEIIEWLGDHRLLILTGARQTGKTSLIYLLIQHLAKNKQHRERIFYFDLEDFELLELCNRGVKSFITYLEQLGVQHSEKSFIFIDEIQYLDNPSNFLKILADHHRNLKIVCSGSSSLEIRRKFRDSLVGRKMVFEIPPLTFSEFLLFKQKNHLSRLRDGFTWDKLFSEKQEFENSVSSILANELQRLFDEFAVYGSYPAVALENVLGKKRKILQEIYQTYVRKDLNELFTIENLTAFNNLVRLLALQQGNLVNFGELATHLGISRPTVEKYIFILENTFVTSVVPPFFINKRTEIVKMPKIYFCDSGIRNQAARNMDSLENRVDAGALVENCVYKSLFASSAIQEKIKFWRTKHGNEVDFVIDDQRPFGVEVKYRRIKKPRKPAGLRSFSAKYQTSVSIIVTRDLLAVSKETTQVFKYVPVWLLE